VVRRKDEEGIKILLQKSLFKTKSSFLIKKGRKIGGERRGGENDMEEEVHQQNTIIIKARGNLM
jgi:hypothetical protein